MLKTIKKITAFAMIGVMVFLLCSCSLSLSGIYEEEVIKRASPIPHTKQEIFDYFCMAYNKARNAKVKVDYEYSHSAGSPDCENSNIEDAFGTIAKLMTDNRGESVEYGNDCTSLVPENKLELKDIRSANIIDIDDPSYRSYTIVLTIWEEKNPTQDNSVFGKVYKLSPKEEILNEFKKGASFFTIEDYQSQYQVGQIRATVLKETDEMSEVAFERTVRVSTEITGQGNLASVGTVPLSFDYHATERYNFDWDAPKTTTKA